MTSVPVTDIGMNVPYVTETGGTNMNTGSGFSESLKTAMGNRKGSMDQSTGADSLSNLSSSQKTDIKTDRTEPSEQMNRQDAGRSEKIDRTEDAQKPDSADDTETVTPETVDKVNDSAKKIVDEVADEMDVTPEEVIDAMETLGLTMTDLLNPDNMTDLVTQLSGNEDTLSLLTDENLYTTLGNLQDFVTETADSLMEELDLSQEAFDGVLAQTEELMQQPGMPVENLEPVMNDMDVADDVNLEGMKDFKVTTTVNGEQVTMDVRVDDTTGAQVATLRTTGEEQQENPSENKGDHTGNENTRDDHTGLFTQTLQLNNNTQQLMGIDEMINEAADFRSEAAEIADQIMESMKANLKPEMTELEMNLHPASLGNVRVNLASQNGQVSAQFLAQNETVKSAIESQVVQLTKQLEDQGIKVEHVEVAVADHSFERNPESGSGQQDPEHQPGKAKVGRIRRLDMNALDEDESMEELEDSDRIAAEIMAHNGNTVDYTV